MKRALAYSGVSLVFLPLNLAIAWLLIQAGVHYLIATVAGYGAHHTLGFFVNRRRTFNNSKVTATAGLIKSYLVGTATFLIAVLVTTAGIEWLKLEFIYARLIAAAIAGSWDYIMNSIFTFRTQPFR